MKVFDGRVVALCGIGEVGCIFGIGIGFMMLIGVRDDGVGIRVGIGINVRWGGIGVTWGGIGVTWGGIEHHGCLFVGHDVYGGLVREEV